jgi:hypothetical protein
MDSLKRVIQVVQVGSWAAVSPEADDAGPQRPVLGDHRRHVEPRPDAAGPVRLGGQVDAGFILPGLTLAPGLLRLLRGGLLRPHVRHGAAEDDFGIIAQLGRVGQRPRSPRGRPDAAREGFPLRKNGFGVGQNEIRQAQKGFLCFSHLRHVLLVEDVPPGIPSLRILTVRPVKWQCRLAHHRDSRLKLLAAWSRGAL